jgi:Cu/Ag efflux pump CusA
MINSILNFAVRQRLLVFLGALILAGFGWLAARQIPIMPSPT